MINKKEFSYTRSGCDFICQYKELTIIIDESSLWEYAQSQGYHEWSVDSFDPNSRYGHTQKCGVVDADEYLKSVDKSVIIEYIDSILNP